MKEVYLLLGTNQGERYSNLAKGVEMLQQEVGELLKISSIYETEAWGLKGQAAFLNQAVGVHTFMTPLTLLATIKVMEEKLGRISTEKWGPRVIDIDILFYGDTILDLPSLKIPHPYLHKRRFTLVPLNEIAANFMHPLLHKPISTLLQGCSDSSEVCPFTL